VEKCTHLHTARWLYVTYLSCKTSVNCRSVPVADGASLRITPRESPMNRLPSRADAKRLTGAIWRRSVVLPSNGVITWPAPRATCTLLPSPLCTIPTAAAAAAIQHQQHARIQAGVDDFMADRYVVCVSSVVRRISFACNASISA